MSVRGEFARTLDAALVCLQESACEPARSLAARLERARGVAGSDLERAARDVLAAWGSARPETLAEGDGVAPLRDAAERLLAISRIILGEPG